MATPPQGPMSLPEMQEAGPLLQLFGCLFFALMLGSMGLVFLPKSLLRQLPKPARTYRNRLLSKLRRSRELSVEGPFYRAVIVFGRTISRGYLSSKPQAPELRAAAYSTKEIQVTITPVPLWNPFHEETYVLLWSMVTDKEPVWITKKLDPKTDCEKVDGKLKLRGMLDGLPEHQKLRVKIATVNAWGQSDFSKEVKVETLARPTDDGSFTGPLGPAAGSGKLYTWAQNQNDVHISIPLGPAPKARDIRFKCTGARLEINFSEDFVGKGKPTELLVGTLFKRVVRDEVLWQIEEDDEKFGRHMFIQLVKEEAMEKWERLIEADGHPRIDTRFLRFFKNEFSEIGDLEGSVDASSKECKDAVGKLLNKYG